MEGLKRFANVMIPGKNGAQIVQGVYGLGNNSLQGGIYRLVVAGMGISAVGMGIILNFGVLRPIKMSIAIPAIIKYKKANEIKEKV